MTKTFDLKIHVCVHDGRITSSMLTSCKETYKDIESCVFGTRLDSKDNKIILFLRAGADKEKQ